MSDDDPGKLAQLLDETIASWSKWHATVENVAEVDGLAVWDSVTRAESRSAGVPYESPSPTSAVLEFRDGLLYRWDVFATRAEAIAHARDRGARA